jgi:tRNA U54 and U55 pseudouridine synthase Pus10
MTLIIKELVVRGIVSNEHSQLGESSIEKEELLNYLEQIKKEIERECTEKVLQKLESKMIR